MGNTVKRCTFRYESQFYDVCNTYDLYTYIKLESIGYNNVKDKR